MTSQARPSRAGSLSVSVRWCDGVLDDWKVDLIRPPVARTLVGLTPSDALARLPLYFSLCSQAQREAGRLALEAAGHAEDEGVASWLLWAECLHEHLWRLLLDWPLTFGEPAQTAVFAAWRAARGQGQRALAEATTRLIDEVLLGGPAGGLVARGLIRLQAEDDSAPLCAGLEARVGAVVAAAEELAADGVYPYGETGQPARGRGEAWIHTARGALHHGVQLSHGSVAGWQVEAPTDRNFVDEKGIVKRLPSSLVSAAAARRAVERAVLVLDPCVPFSVEILNA
jgi:uptake hydrogenase large subunit